MQRSLKSRESPVTAKQDPRAAIVAGDVRRAALRAAAAVLLDELEPTSQEAILDFAEEGNGSERWEVWEVIIGALDWSAKKCLTSDLRSTG